mmetsp:Transcript_89141/g.252730  ORF Transcript_89141/g.252730 Transcript_89141/m.252730 type:complete len:344 (-) Transcript_89141:589-1620(-)
MLAWSSLEAAHLPGARLLSASSLARRTRSARDRPSVQKPCARPPSAISSTASSVSSTWGSHFSWSASGSWSTKRVISASSTPVVAIPLPIAPPRTVREMQRKKRSFRVSHNSCARSASRSLCCGGAMSSRSLRQVPWSRLMPAWAGSPTRTLPSPPLWLVARISPAAAWAVVAGRAMGTAAMSWIDSAVGGARSLTLPPPTSSKTSGYFRRKSAGRLLMMAVTGFLNRCRKRPQSDEMYTESAPSCWMSLRNSSTTSSSVTTSGAGSRASCCARDARCAFDVLFITRAVTSGWSLYFTRDTLPPPTTMNLSGWRLKRSRGRMLVMDVTDTPLRWMNLPQSAET